MLLLLVPWMLMARKRLRRGKWMSADHEGQYGKAFKFKGMQGWSGSGQLARRLRAAARRELDVYQFGVYTGGSMASIARRIRGFGHLWGFDSFSGLPSETAGVSVEGVHWRPGAFSSADALGEWDEARLLEQLTSRIRFGNLTFVPGYYNVSLTDELARTHAFQPALLVDVDVDLHSSTMQCMSWLLAHRLLDARCKKGADCRRFQAVRVDIGVAASFGVLDCAVAAVTRGDEGSVVAPW